MLIPKTEKDLNDLIINKIEESNLLDYKERRSLVKSKDNIKRDELKNEVTKDVSAFANSAGGVIIYGMSEGEGETKHLPIKISPICRIEFSKERLEHIIGQIQPRLEVEIIPIPLESSPTDVAYVVVIPQSTTAHQATDKLYYKRFNFESVAMSDYEIRDVMNRIKHPCIDLEFELHRYPSKPIKGPNFMQPKPNEERLQLLVYGKNNGQIVAQFINAFVHIDRALWCHLLCIFNDIDLNNQPDSIELKLSNKKRETNNMGTPIGNSMYEPILPGLRLQLGLCDLKINAWSASFDDHLIKWSVHADSSPKRANITRLGNIVKFEDDKLFSPNV